MIEPPRAARVAAVVAAALLVSLANFVQGAERRDRYYARAAVHDEHGVIAPWYKGQNGQVDWRLRIAAETIKRYPWVEPPNAPSAAPHFVYNGHWTISDKGAITPIPIKDWDNGDLGQRAAYVLSAMVDYYRYSGDPAALAIMTIQADAILDHACAPDDHPWPRFPISVPVKGKPYAAADPAGMIQLDIAAEIGTPLLRAYQITGNRRWLLAAQHWGDLFAAKRNPAPGAAPWGRYANPEAAPWPGKQQTGGIVFILEFLDELIRVGYRGTDDAIVKARDAGRAWLRDALLPNWTVNDVWGRNYWDWEDPVQAENVTEFVVGYMMEHPDAFPNWRNDCRNILTLFFNHTSVDPASGGEVFSGAWAFPESNGCCGRSLWYGPMELASTFARYGALTESPWAREVARRMQILATYDGHETGVSEDNIDGGFIVNADWFKIAHPMALKHLLATIAWMPEEFGPARENHVVRSTAVVSRVSYLESGLEWTTFDAPAPTVTTLRLAYLPDRLADAAGGALERRDDLAANGYTARPLGNGDFIVAVRHDGVRDLRVSGGNPEQTAERGDLARAGEWTADEASKGYFADQAGASTTINFTGNRVRLMGRTAPDGGRAEVELDGVKQLVGIDCWRPESVPAARDAQVLYYINGLAPGPHALKITTLGAKNPLSKGTRVYIDGASWSAAEGSSGFGAGGGPTDAQRLIFGYTGREDLKDAAGNLWRPGTEFVVRFGPGADSVAGAWWTEPTAGPIANATDPELYRRGVHGRDFTVNVTVGPGTYHVRLKFAAGRLADSARNCATISINGREVAQRMDVAATAGGINRGVDLVFNDVQPQNGVIAIRFIGGTPGADPSGEAFVQAIEVAPGPGGAGATPVQAP